MKALKTIVATAVIVFALTTVAMAGVQRFSSPAGSNTQAGSVAQAGAQPSAAQPAGDVTLSAQQFAALLRAVGRDTTQDRSRDGSHAQNRDRTQERDRQQARTHTADDGASATMPVSRHSAQDATHHSTAHHSTTHHSTTHHSTTHGGGTHDGGHDGGCD